MKNKNFKELLSEFKKRLAPFLAELKPIYEQHKKWVWIGGISLLFLIAFSLRSNDEKETYVFKREKKIELEGGQMMVTQKSVTDSKDAILNGRLRILENAVKQISVDLGSLKSRLEATPAPTPTPQATVTPLSQNAPMSPSISVNGQAPGIEPKTITSRVPRAERESINMGFEGSGGRRRRESFGPQTISFPVKNSQTAEQTGIVMPAGSHCRAQLLSGVPALEGKPLPVLLQADVAVGPNQTTFDLAGCFMIAMGEANMSLEKAELQIKTLSCSSRDGKMFERKVNAFVTGEADSEFGLSGELQSKQDRVAKMAFLSKLVEGAAKGIQQRQTEQTRDRYGTTTQLVTGDELKFATASGLGSAAEGAAAWFLKAASELSPSIKIASGKKVFVVFNEKVDLPASFFKHGDDENSNFTYLSSLF